MSLSLKRRCTKLFCGDTMIEIGENTAFSNTAKVVAWVEEDKFYMANSHQRFAQGLLNVQSVRIKYLTKRKKAKR